MMPHCRGSLSKIEVDLLLFNYLVFRTDKFPRLSSLDDFRALDVPRAASGRGETSARCGRLTSSTKYVVRIRPETRTVDRDSLLPGGHGFRSPETTALVSAEDIFASVRPGCALCPAPSASVSTRPRR